MIGTKKWTLDIQNQSWVEDTRRQVDFLIEKLELKESEKVLDLACGFGRHSLELARRGFDVIGVDITADYIDYANEQAKKENLNAYFICSDIREISFQGEFDVVLNMADGAVGYLENEEENTIRLYSLSEIKGIFDGFGMTVYESYADFIGKPSSSNSIQLMVYSQKR